MPIWTWDYSLADAKITNVKNSNNHLLLEVDCSCTALHSRQYITMLIFENCVIQELPDIIGMFWYSVQVSRCEDKFQLCLVVTDKKNHKRSVKFKFSTAKYQE